MEKKIYLNDNWKFSQDFKAEMVECGYDDSGMERVRLPHTCQETPFDYFDESIYQMVSAYRREIVAEESWRGKEVLLTIEGAAHESEVYLNGKKLGEHHCGYTAFQVRLNEALKYDEKNILTVRVNSKEDINVPPFGFVVDYMTYGGIYRDVYLEIKNPTYIEDVFVKPEVEKENIEKTDCGFQADTSLKSIVQLKKQESSESGKGKLKVVQSLKLLGGLRTGESRVYAEKELTGSEVQAEISFVVKKALLWDIESPMLYSLKTELFLDGVVVDTKEVRFGFRKSEFLKDGYYLNGRKVKLRGLNRHQCFPYVGYAMPKSMQRRDADILKKELGLNAVRTSHYPQSHYFLERCDELGLLVFTEMPGWQHIGDEAWKNQAVQNVTDMITQYRNHTSIILWGVRINESVDDDAFYERTNKAAHEADDTRPTGGVRAIKKSNLLEDVYTYNDFVHDGKLPGCEPKKAITSNNEKPYLISEYNGHMFPTKSFDCEDHRVEHLLRHANVLDAVLGQEDIAGSFGWCMFDYNTHKDFGSGDRVCYHGVMDMFRNPKLAADIYAAQQDEEPVLSVSSSMDIGEHPGCNRGNAYVFTNADSVKMYKNNVFVKEFFPKDSAYKNLKNAPILLDDFIGDTLKNGENFTPDQAEKVKKILNAVARFGMGGIPKKLYLSALSLVFRYGMKMTDAIALYVKYVGDWGGESTSHRFEAIKDGKVVKTVVKEPVEKCRMKVDVTHQELREETTYDVAALRISMTDQNDNVLNYFNEPIVLEAEGEIEIIGPKVTALRGGMGGTYVKTTGKSGKGVLTICSEHCEARKITFNCK